MDERVKWGIGNFFGWYRRRLANVRALSTLTAPSHEAGTPGSFLPDQHVLIGAGIDALSTAWAEMFRPDRAGGPAGARWSDFLQENADDKGLFGRISAPLLADHLEEQGMPDAAGTIRRISGDDNRGGIVRFAEEDPEFMAFVARPEVVALALPARWLERFRFGEVLYSEHRCQWSHRFYSSDKLAPSDHDEMTGWAAEYNLRVRYQNHGVKRAADNMLLVARRRPIFSLPWLLQVYEATLSTFEQRCLVEERDPMPSAT